MPPIRQASTIPLRRRDGKTEVCLITSIRRGRWAFPKGIIDPGDSPEETALNESAEEAGLFGSLIGPSIGQYSYEKWGTTLDVAVYLMRVERSADSWVESDVRERRWVDPAAARRLLPKQELRDLLDEAVRTWEQIS